MGALLASLDVQNMIGQKLHQYLHQLQHEPLEKLFWCASWKDTGKKVASVEHTGLRNK